MTTPNNAPIPSPNREGSIQLVAKPCTEIPAGFPVELCVPGRRPKRSATASPRGGRVVPQGVTDAAIIASTAKKKRGPKGGSGASGAPRKGA